jgi:hypothetical protein
MHGILRDLRSAQAPLFPAHRVKPSRIEPSARRGHARLGIRPVRHQRLLQDTGPVRVFGRKLRRPWWSVKRFLNVRHEIGGI